MKYLLIGALMGLLILRVVVSDLEAKREKELEESSKYWEARRRANPDPGVQDE